MFINTAVFGPFLSMRFNQDGSFQQDGGFEQDISVQRQRLGHLALQVGGDELLNLFGPLAVKTDQRPLDCSFYHDGELRQDVHVERFCQLSLAGRIDPDNRNPSLFIVSKLFKQRHDLGVDFRH